MNAPDASVPPAIVAHELSHAFDGQPALRRVAFAVEPGTIVALIGPNGGGKTTLLRILAGHLRPTHGRANVAGYDVARQGAAVRGCVGYVAHHSLAYPSLTVIENLMFFAALYAAPASRLEPLLRSAGLWPLRGRRVATLSRGQLQRLALCRAVLHDPPVLLLDEPHSALDARAAAQLDRLLLELADSGRTALLATHDADRACQLADRVLVLEAGRLVWDGPPVELVAGGCVSAELSRSPGAGVVWARWPGSEPRPERGLSPRAGGDARGPALSPSPPADLEDVAPGRAGRPRRSVVGEGTLWPSESEARGCPAQPSFGQVVAAVGRKDLLTEWRSRDVVPPAIVFALLVIVLLHYALPLEAVSGRLGGAIANDSGRLAARAVPGALWVAFLFGSTLGLSRAWPADEGAPGQSILAITPADRSHLFVAKWLVGIAFGLLVALVLVPAAAILLGLPVGPAAGLLAVLALALVGWSAAGTLVAALTAHSRARQVLLPVVLFPMVLPLAISGLQASVLLAGGSIAAAVAPLAIVLATGTLFVVLGWLLFPLTIEFGL